MLRRFPRVPAFCLVAALTLVAARRAAALRQPRQASRFGQGIAHRAALDVGMTLRDEVAQLVFIPFHGESPNTRSREYRKFVRLIREERVGGLIL